MLRLPLRTLVALAALAVVAPPASAGEELNLGDWLGRPGVKLLAVEFYATWCKPCMEAMPRWAALKDKYRKQGLRVVVVNTLDPQGGCRGIGWSPDETVCDLEGKIAESFRLNGQLPAAFLWSWQGNLLVQKGHVAEVEREVARYLGEAPRLAIEAGAGVGAAEVAALRERLSDDGKLTVVAGEAERALLQKAMKKQQGASYDERLQCELGKEVPANAVLKASRVAQGKTAFLNLAVLDLETGCQTQVVSAPWDSDPRAMATEALGKLLGRLKRGGLQMPGGAVVAPKAAAKEVKPASVREDEKAVDLGGDDDVVVEFNSEPEGIVRVDGKLLCKATPCKKEVAAGNHEVEVEAEGYVSEKKAVQFGPKNRRFAVKLLADFGLLTVTSEPSGLKVEIDGEAETAPVQGRRLAPGKAHTVKLAEPCYLGAEERFAVARGESKAVALQGRVRKAGLKVKAEDDKGDVAEVEVRVDGAVVGQTPWKGEVAVCAKELAVGGKGYALKLEEGKVQELKVVVAGKAAAPGGSSGGASAAGSGWVRIEPGSFVMGSPDSEAGRDSDETQHKVTITRAFWLKATEVTQGEWQAVMGGNPARFTGCGANCPVEQVSWTDAVAFCNKLSERENLPVCYQGDRFVGLGCKGYRLPTEAEWEYAARAGTTAERYGASDKVAWYDENSDSKTHAVAGKHANAWGLYDMLGNVWEWTNDWKADYGGAAVDPVGPNSGAYRVLRGGSWDGFARYARAASRFDRGPAFRSSLVGFRPARSVP